MPGETDASAQDRRELPDSVVIVARENPRERSLFSIAAAAALALVHRRTTTRRTGPFAQRIRPRPRGVRDGNDFDGGADPVVRVDARRLRDKLREYYDGQSNSSSLRCRKAATYRSSKRIPPHSPTRLLHHPPTPPPVVHAEPEQQQTPPVAELQAHEDRGQRAGDRRCDCRSRHCLARRRQAGERSNPTTPFGFVPEVWRGHLPCPRTATSLPSPGRAKPRLARRISM